MQSGLKQKSELIPDEQQLKFGKYWIQYWMEEHNGNVRKTNKRYTIKKEDQVVRLQDYLKNI